MRLPMAMTAFSTAAWDSSMRTPVSSKRHLASAPKAHTDRAAHAAASCRQRKQIS